MPGRPESDLLLVFKRIAGLFSPPMKDDTPHTPKVDLILVFRASGPGPQQTSNLKDDVRTDAQEAETEYTRLLDTIRRAGLRASGKRGQKNGQVLVFLWAPARKLARLVKRERFVLSSFNL